MNLRRLTPDGVAQYHAYLINLKTEPTLAPPEYLLGESATSEAVSAIELERPTFETRFQAAQYLDTILGSTELREPERDTGLWAWLTLYYFDQLCPPRNGMRKAGELARYIPAVADFQRFYRHLLLGPYLIYRAHADNPARALAVLVTPLHAPGELVEQLASRQELITNNVVMSVTTRLYFDPNQRRLKRGSGGKGPGSPRRLADMLNQFDLTYDLYELGETELLSFLPTEFNRFRGDGNAQNEQIN